MSHFLDRLTFFKKVSEPFSNGHGITTDEDRRWVAKSIHQQPQLACDIAYDRSHTGFVRTITVKLEDIQRLYLSRQ